MAEAWYDNFNIGNYFMPIIITPVPAPTPVGYRRKIVCITKAKAGATEGFIEINNFNDVEDYTDNTEVFALQNAGLLQIFLLNLNTGDEDLAEDILRDNITKYFTIAITSDFTPEEKADIVIPGEFDGGVITNFTDKAMAKAFAGGVNQGSSCDKDLYNFLLMVGKVLANRSGWFNNYGADIKRVGYIRTNPQDYLDERISFIISNTENGVNKIGGLFLGGRPFTTPYILDEIKVNLQDTWIAYRATNGLIKSSEFNCARVANRLQQLIDQYIETDDNPNLPLSSGSVDVSPTIANDFAFNCTVEISKITDIIQLITTLSEVA